MDVVGSRMHKQTNVVCVVRNERALVPGWDTTECIAIKHQILINCSVEIENI